MTKRSKPATASCVRYARHLRRRELHADFVPEEYPVRYYLHGGENTSGNPPVYTIESAAITLAAPSKTCDVFTG
ncbi:MAG: hypothetical protein LBL33_03540 [Tannerella sp.]|nr:hypothetical protein [Tannerella sp.]